MTEKPSKRLVIMRHAKSDWPDGVSDHDRPLLERGYQEAALAGLWLRDNDVRPDYILCSSAVRTQQTCAGVRAALGAGIPEPVVSEELYAAFPKRMLSVINHVPDSIRTLLVIAHMPGVQELILALASAHSQALAYQQATARFPTSALAVLTVDKPWVELDGQDALLQRFVVPRAE
ncbi:SixA phosphatase family protein [Glaciibacter psychrotolerans]|uniref:Phosphohistidine phosphatase n=1 Tax=Glaciibacter psychrotolerans TaxID=670054 RepID=A0A7Z0J5F9_9MICO|nr:histidine phosphatase family protein [Leifsonia psychrotolerans]NYJ19101.1 phosphohistidine phosphatase [Leifsonia psychrotolerans]